MSLKIIGGLGIAALGTVGIIFVSQKNKIVSSSSSGFEIENCVRSEKELTDGVAEPTTEGVLKTIWDKHKTKKNGDSSSQTRNWSDFKRWTRGLSDGIKECRYIPS